MANTTNFGWETPDDTDLVKDGAAAMRTLGNSIDASFVDLKGGTTGQVLAKNSNTDLDFVWTNGGDITEVAAGVGISGGGTSGAVTITNSMATAIDAKGDLVAGTGADAFARLAVGANGTVLTANSSTATGLEWTSPSAGANWTLLNAGGTTLTGAATVTVSGISNRDKIMVIVRNASSTVSGVPISIRVNGLTTGIYNYYGMDILVGSTYNSANFGQLTGNSDTNLPVAVMSANASSQVSGGVVLTGCAASGVKQFFATGGASASGNPDQFLRTSAGWIDTSASITSVSVVAMAGNLDNGTVFVYTSA